MSLVMSLRAFVGSGDPLCGATSGALFSEGFEGEAVHGGQQHERDAQHARGCCRIGAGYPRLPSRDHGVSRWSRKDLVSEGFDVDEGGVKGRRGISSGCPGLGINEYWGFLGEVSWRAGPRARFLRFEVLVLSVDRSWLLELAMSFSSRFPCACFD